MAKTEHLDEKQESKNALLCVALVSLVYRDYSALSVASH